MSLMFSVRKGSKSISINTHKVSKIGTTPLNLMSISSSLNPKILALPHNHVHTFAILLFNLPQNHLMWNAIHALIITDSNYKWGHCMPNENFHALNNLNHLMSSFAVWTCRDANFIWSSSIIWVRNSVFPIQISCYDERRLHCQQSK